MRRIAVIGAGYVGLVTATCFAEMGHEVLCLDIDKNKIHLLKQGIIPIYELGLEEMVRRNMNADRLRFTSCYEKALAFADLLFLAVATPSSADGSADLSCIETAISAIVGVLNRDIILVNKSTVPVGTTEWIRNTMVQRLRQKGCCYNVDVVFNPEFLKEGTAVNDFMKPDRIIIGTESQEVALVLRELYAPFNINHDRLLVMDVPSAEMTKYAANAMLASRISFMNELSHLCEKLGADISWVRKGIGSDKRIGHDFLYAGAGYGGSCFPKDIRALRALARSHNISTPLLDAIESANERQKRAMCEKVENYFEGQLENKVIAIWGLSFKPGTDDMREASSLVLIRFLLQKGAYLRLFDPIAIKRAKELLTPSPQILFVDNEYEAARGAHAIVLMTEWKQFRFVNFEKILPTMLSRVFFDGRNQYSIEEMQKLGFDYLSIGRKKMPPILDKIFSPSEVLT